MVHAEVECVTSAGRYANGYDICVQVLYIREAGHFVQGACAKPNMSLWLQFGQSLLLSCSLQRRISSCVTDLSRELNAFVHMSDLSLEAELATSLAE